MPPNWVPYEVIAQPFSMFLADHGEAFPDLDTDPPGGNWTEVGTSGSRNLTEDGVVIRHPQTMEAFRGFGGTGPIKLFRTEEDFIVTVNMADMTLEQYALALNNNTVTTTPPGAGPAGFKEVDIYRGADAITVHALLLRGPSPYGDGWIAQLEMPACVHSGSPELQIRKGEPAVIVLEFQAIEDPDAATAAERFGRLIFQNADPT